MTHLLTNTAPRCPRCGHSPYGGQREFQRPRWQCSHCEYEWTVEARRDLVRPDSPEVHPQEGCEP